MVARRGRGRHRYFAEGRTIDDASIAEQRELKRFLHRAGSHGCKFFDAQAIRSSSLLYRVRRAATVAAMLYPTPRGDRWDPWIALTLLAILVAAAAAIHLFG
jgi:hypothetical protein